MDRETIHEKVAQCLVEASTAFRPDQVEKYEEAISTESHADARWVLERILENAKVASENFMPLCDDTGIPHVIAEIGRNACLDSAVDAAIQEGVRLGLQRLPGRPMAVKGDALERLSQEKGLYEAPEALAVAPILFRPFAGEGLRITVMMLGGGPEIRGKTYRVFHKHDSMTVLNEIGQWAKEVASQLGCTPSVPAVGIGRTHYEATVLMLEAMKDGCFDRQSKEEKLVTAIVNESAAGPLGLGGRWTALGAFIKIGPQRASGVRIACMRPGCCFDPRRATVSIQ